MATYTTNYNLNKPTFAELADVRTFNGNMDIIDDVMNASQNSIAEPYDSTETYDEGDMVMYELYLYRCLEETTGTWDATKWERAYSASSGAGITYPQDATKYLNGVGQWTVPAGGGGTEPIKEVLFDVPDSTSAWASPIMVTCNPLDYDLITVEVQEDGNDVLPSVICFAPYSVGLDIDVSGDTYKTEYKLGEGNKVYISRTATAVGIWTNTGTTLTLNKVVGYRFCGAIQPLIYSTEEREVGVWVDNKPLYQKTVSLTITSTTTNISSISNIDTLVNAHGILSDSNGGMSEIPYTDGEDYAGIGFVNDNIGLYCSSWFVNNRPDLTLTVWYTKTTDTAGSGSYNTLGVPTHHYSTDEQVIGTWIDGSTLYEKTIDMGSTQTYSNADWYSIEPHQNEYALVFNGKLIDESGLGYNVDMACNDATNLKMYVSHNASGRYLTFQYTKAV